MQKELIISTTSQETKVAILEDDELVEFYIERHRSQGIAGNIYKGKVTKVLPGMQSAFVDIGLERDAFLYVSDFFEDTEEYDKIPSLESKSYEPRPDDRTYGTGSIEVLPGESLAKYSRRHGPEAGGGENALEDKNAPLGAVAEEAPVPRPEAERRVPPRTVSIPAALTRGGGGTGA